MRENRIQNTEFKNAKFAAILSPVCCILYSQSELTDNASMIRNIIFDVDGTLLDSKRDIAGAQLWVLQQLGVENYTEEDLYPHIGKTLQETFTLLLPDRLHPKIPEAAIMYRDYYRPRALENTKLFPV